MKTMSVAIFAALAPLALGSCPNGCNNHGTCGQYDMCTCYRGYRGADCSKRVCPSEYSFVTSPHGDLNYDGDAYDSFLKPIVGSKAKGTAAQTLEPIHGGNQVIMTGSMSKNDNKLTFDVAGAVAQDELVVGDSVLIDEETFIITATDWKAASTGQASAYYMATRAKTAHVARQSQVFKMLEAQGQEGGTWESWPGFANAKYDEAHFYMECSNKGLCDQSTGSCKCFEGYEGKACSRMKCPGEDSPCSGHGACQDVATMAWSSPALASFTAKSAAVGASSIPVSKSIAGTAFATDLPYIRFGRYQNETVKVTSIAVDGLSFNINHALDQPLEDFTEIYVVHEYKLWDSKKARSCTCDAGWTGYDCASRVCPKGDDPLTVDDKIDTDSTYTQENEKQTISIVGSVATPGTGLGAGWAVTGPLGLTFTDQYGYEWDAQADLFTKLSVKVTYDGTSGVLTFATAIPKSEITVGGSLTFDGATMLTTSTCTQDSTLKGSYASCVTATGGADVTTAATMYSMGYHNTVEKALLGLPNDVIPAVTVSSRVSKDHSLGSGQVTEFANSYRMRVDFTSSFNSGDLPEMGCNTSELVTAKYIAGRGSVVIGSVSVATTTHLGVAVDYSSGSAAAVGDMILMGREKRRITALASGVLTVDRPFAIEYEDALIGIISDLHSAKITCTVTDEPMLIWGAAGAYSGIAKVDATDLKTVTGIDDSTTLTAANLLDWRDVRVNTIIKAANVGGHADSSAAATSAPTGAPTFMPTATTVRRRLLAAGDDPTSFADLTAFGAHYTGDFEYRVVDEITLSGTTLSSFTVSESFDQADQNKWQYAWISEKGRTESMECSRRGSCDGESGQCVCYTGYTGAACQTQNALSV